MQTSSVLITPPGPDYELLDSGEGEKLEKFGQFVLSRPDPQALWKKNLSKEEWDKADAYFTRGTAGADWTYKPGFVGEKWPISFGGLKFWIKPTAFKHTGLFPEQQPNWDWLRKTIEASIAERSPEDVPEVLNLFGYTGGATLACAQAGAKLVHIDGSKAAVTWARENSELSGIGDKPMRWIMEDARTFVERELRRDRHYDGIIMDPPAFGHGPDNELWKIEVDFLELLDNCKKLLKPKPLFFLINGYSAGYSSIAYGNNLLPLREQFGGTIETGELTIQEKSGRLLPAGIFARWSAK
jgi:23S rRNA (cytosine1962-C5)-methyltransferase